MDLQDYLVRVARLGFILQFWPDGRITFKFGSTRGFLAS